MNSLLLVWVTACSGPSTQTGELQDRFDRAACLNDSTCKAVLSVGHRGVMRFAPENTILGFQMAEDMGLHAIELDIRVTLDEQLVVIHDSTMDRTTNGSGLVADLTLAEIQSFVAQSEFEAIADQPIPSLQQALLALQDNTLVNLDVKTDRWDLVAATIAELGFYDRVWAQTDTLLETQSVRETYPSFILMADAETADEVEALAPFLPEFVEIPNLVMEAAPFEASADIGARVAQNALGVADLGALVDVGRGGDGSVAYQALIDRGVHIIQTDVPELLVPFVQQENLQRGGNP
jgi:glycerophosphoryl diester phosphodiesterase